MISRILIPVEDSYFAEAIASLLAQLKFEDFTIFRLLHVIAPLEEKLNWPSDEYRKEIEELLSAVAVKLRKQFPQVMVEEIILEGHAAETIIDDALAWEADLIIAGSHGKRGLRRFALGSVAGVVSANAPCSVLVVRPEVAYPRQSDRELRRRQTSVPI